MTYLLDTNVVSGLRRPPHRADAGVRDWVASLRPSDLYLSVVTVLEVELGITRLARRDQTQSTRLRTWLEDDLLDIFAGRLLPVDVAVARGAARLHVPDPRPERDALIAATAAVHGLSVVTCDVKDLQLLGVVVINQSVADVGPRTGA